MERVPKVHSSLISTVKSGIKVLMMNRLFFYGLVLSFSILVLPLTASAYSGNIYLSSFQDIDWTKYLTGEIYYNFGSGPGSPTYYSYCVDRTNPMPVPASYYAESQSIAGNTGLLKAAWLIDNYAASKPYIYPGSTALETGVALQLAIWDQIGQGITYNSTTYAGNENLFAMKNYFDSQVPTGDLSSYASKFDVLKIYTTDASGNHLQDIESLTPVPIPAAFYALRSRSARAAGYEKKNHSSRHMNWYDSEIKQH